MEYISNSPSPNHAVQNGINMLQDQQFIKLDERKPWPNLQPGGKYYFEREAPLGSSLVAFTVGKKYRSESCFKILGAHTDSPNLRVKVRGKMFTHVHVRVLLEDEFMCGFEEQRAFENILTSQPNPNNSAKKQTYSV